MRGFYSPLFDLRESDDENVRKLFACYVRATDALSLINDILDDSDETKTDRMKAAKQEIGSARKQIMSIGKWE